MANHFAVVGLPFFWTSDRINKGVKNASDCSEIKSKKGELLALSPGHMYTSLLHSRNQYDPARSQFIPLGGL
jgi:hypothetical protein